MKLFYIAVLRITLVTVLMSIPTLASAYQVQGRFIEASGGDPCVATPYNIYSATDTTKSLLGAAADLDGSFNQQLAQAGKYILKAQYPGMSPISVTFEITPANPTANLGDIKFVSTDRQLEEVVVVARRDLIKSDGAKLTYDVENDPASATNTVMEMLRRVPMVTVDGEDNIKVQGQSNFKIYVNGKPDPMLSGDPKSVLKAMPAASIKKIEVITDPGAKYEAEGTAGILNIITVQKQSLEGYSGNVRAGFNNRGYNGSLYARTKIHNVMAAIRLTGLNGNVLRSHNRSYSEREDFNSDENHFYRSQTKSLNKFSYWQGGFDLSWEPDTLNLFTVSSSYQEQSSTSTSNQFLSMSSIDEVLQWSYRRTYQNKYNYIGISANASYQHTFPNSKQHTFTLTYQFNYGSSPKTNMQRTFDYIDFPGSHEPFRNHLTRNYYGTHTFQADYVLPLFGEKHTLETGAKAAIRPNRESEWTASSPDGTDYTDDTAVKLTQHNDVYAAYLSYSASFGKFSSRAGLRYEHTRMGIDYHRLINTAEYSDFNQHLNDWVPNASLTYNLTQTSNLRLSYAMRIWRPGVSQLNPFVNDMTFGEIDYGNPDLKSEKRHNIELKYSNYGGKLGGEFSVRYIQSDNSIESYEFIQDNVLHNTYANIGHYRSFSLGTYLEYQITPTMNASVWIGGAYEHYKAASLDNASAHGWQSNVNINYSYSMPWKLRLDAWGGLWTPWIDLQSKANQTGYYYGLSLSRTFLRNDKLRIGINAGDFLEAVRRQSYTTTSPNSKSVTKYDYRPWSLGISVTYNFGSLRSDVKRTRASVSNDDVSSGSSKNKGGN